MEYVFIVAVLLLFMALFALLIRDSEDRRGLAFSELLNDSTLMLSEPANSSDFEVINQIFSSADVQFISECNNRNLVLLFQHERKRLALCWINRKTIQATLIMRRHLQASRVSIDLQISSEVAVWAKYLELKLICASMTMAVHLVGPQNLGLFAGKANATFARLRNIAGAEEIAAV